MSDYQLLNDTLDAALHCTKFDQRLGAENRRNRQIFLEYLASNIRNRLDRGRGLDCDEWLSLKKFAKRENYGA